MSISLTRRLALGGLASAAILPARAQSNAIDCRDTLPRVPAVLVRQRVRFRLRSLQASRASVRLKMSSLTWFLFSGGGLGRH